MIFKRKYDSFDTGRKLPAFYEVGFKIITVLTVLISQRVKKKKSK